MRYLPANINVNLPRWFSVAQAESDCFNEQEAYAGIERANLAHFFVTRSLVLSKAALLVAD